MVKELWQQRALVERGMILLALRVATAPNLDAPTLRGVLDQLGLPTDAEHFRRHLEYLAEKQYIRRHQVQAMGMRFVYWHITATGRDVLLGVIEDPGVQVPEYEDD